MNLKQFVITVLGLCATTAYLFASAPPPLTGVIAAGRTIPVKTALDILNKENSTVRQLYAKDIVGEGQKRGLKFDEHWADPDVVAGLLPAQFMRETSRHLEASPVQLGLFLGSDNAINQANFFEGLQAEMYKRVKETREPMLVYTEDTKRYAYMFPDIAGASSCTGCHNNHPDSPKKDWQLNDVMGGTTWTYPNETLSAEEFLAGLAALREGFATAYSKAIAEMEQLPNPPRVGEKWPRDGYFIPSVEVFMTELKQRASQETLEQLIATTSEAATQHAKIK